MLLFIIVIMLLIPSLSWAQDDFIPGLPAFQQPVIGPIYQNDPNRFIVGDIPFTWVQMPGQPGDEVQFEIIVQTGPQDKANQADDGQLFLSVVCDGCKDIRYTAGDDGYISDEEQWGHGWWGFYCRRCGWSAQVTSPNPTFKLTAVYYKRLKVITHIEWTGTISRPPPALKLYTEQQKADSRWWKDEIVTPGKNYIESITVPLCTAKTWPKSCAAGSIANFGAGLLKDYLSTKIEDPPDNCYYCAAEPDFRNWNPSNWWTDASWSGESDMDSVIEAAIAASAYTEAAIITINRASTCLQVLSNSPSNCDWQIQRLKDLSYDAGWWFQEMGNRLLIIRDQTPDDGSREGFNAIINAFWSTGSYLENQ